MKKLTISNPDQAKQDAHICLKIVQDAKKDTEKSEFLDRLEEKMKKLVDSIDKLE